MERLQAAGVPSGAIHDYGQVFHDPHLEARDFFWDAPHSTLGTLRQLGSPMRLAETPARRRAAGPRLGEHSAEILHELGFDDADVARLAAEGVVSLGDPTGARPAVR